MGLFKKSIPLIGINYTIQDNSESADIYFKHPELKPIEFVYLAIYQFAKVAYIVEEVSEALLLIINSYAEIDKDDLPICTNNLMNELRLDVVDEENKFTSILYFKRLIEREIKTKIPFRLSQIKLLRTIPFTIDLAYKNSDSLGKEILKVSIPYQANLYKDKNYYRSLKSLKYVPISVFQYGLDNRDIEKDL